MTLRTKVPLVGVAVLLAATLALGTLMLLLMRENVENEVRLRARTFLDALAIQATSDIAMGRIDALDRMVTGLSEQELEQLDVQFVTVLGADRRVVAHTQQFEYGSIANDRFSVEATALDHPIERRVFQDEREILLVSRPLVTQIGTHAPVRWGTLVTGIGLGRVQRVMARTLIGVVAAVLLATMLAAALLLVILNAQVAEPLRTLTDAAAEYGRGNMSARVPVRGGDEITMLAATFNRMADTVENHTRELESQVDERTRELQSANRLLAEANARLRELATTDGLTGLHNFRHFDATLRLEIQRAERLDQPLALLVIDVDHFKEFNDSHGHPAGDRALQDIAETLRSRMRITDTVCRTGGEEFAIILPSTTSVQAAGLADMLRQRVDGMILKDDRGQDAGSTTISVGVAAFPEHAPDASTLVRTADDALYRAKNAGRNQVAVAMLPQRPAEGES
jgi:diguanylate cyclase (GGDEF)-like protein